MYYGIKFKKNKSVELQFALYHICAGEKHPQGTQVRLYLHSKKNADFRFIIVCKGVSPPISKAPSPVFKIPIPPPYQKITLPKFSLLTEIKFNKYYKKQQYNVCFFIFKFTLKYMLDNVYINKVCARYCLCI